MSLDDNPYDIEIKLPNAQGFLSILSTVKPPNKQNALLIFTPQGMSLKWENESKTMQSGVFLGAELFTSYYLKQHTQFFIHFNTFLHILAVFASSSDISGLTLSYPGPEQQLVLEAHQYIADEDTLSNNLIVNNTTHSNSNNTQGGLIAHTARNNNNNNNNTNPSSQQQQQQQSTVPSTYARIPTLDGNTLSDVLDYFQDPTSSFICPSRYLKEIIDDLDWVKGDISIDLVRDPAKIRMSSDKHGKSLQIDFPPSLLTTLNCSFPSIHHTYLDKNIRIAFTNISTTTQQQQQHDGAPPRPERNTTKVTIDAHGVMKVTHMLQINLSQYQQEMATHPLASVVEGERETTMAGVAVAQFVLLPLDDSMTMGDDDDDDDGNVGGGGGGGNMSDSFLLE